MAIADDPRYNPVNTPKPNVDSRVALRKLQSGQSLTDAEKEILNLPSTFGTKPAPTPTPTPTPTPAPVVVENPPGNKPSVDTQELPPGFTPGPYPQEFYKFFGQPPANIMGYKIDEYTDGAGKRYYKVSISQKGEYGTAKSGFITFGGALTKDANGNWSVYNAQTSSVSAPVQQPSESIDTGSIPAGLDSGTKAFIQSLQNQINTLTNQNISAAAEAKAAAAKVAESQRQSIISVLSSRFGQYGLGSLVNKIKELAVDGATEATITLALQNTEEYKMRFAANEDRIKKGLSVLTPAEYISNEDAYRQTLRAYGLTQFDNDQYVRQFIANDVSPQELSSRVSIAVQRVQNADPAVTKTLRDYYGIGVGDMVGYILDPNQALPKIQQQVAAAEIGTAARRQGLEAGVTVAEQLARQGITEAEAQKGYATIADILPSAEKLSQIYGTSLEEYGQTEAEQEVFNSLASAQRKRRALTAREVATFSGSSGTGRGSLGTSTAGQI